MAILDAPRPAVIRLFLAQGTAEGFGMIEKSNWTGLGLVSSRADYLGARQGEEWARRPSHGPRRTSLGAGGSVGTEPASATPSPMGTTTVSARRCATHPGQDDSLTSR